MLANPSFARFLAAATLLTGALFCVAAAGAATPEPLSVQEVAPGVFVHQGRYELFTPRNEGDVSNAASSSGVTASP